MLTLKIKYIGNVSYMTNLLRASCILEVKQIRDFSSTELRWKPKNSDSKTCNCCMSMKTKDLYSSSFVALWVHFAQQRRSMDLLFISFYFLTPSPSAEALRWITLGGRIRRGREGKRRRKEEGARQMLLRPSDPDETDGTQRGQASPKNWKSGSEASSNDRLLIRAFHGPLWSK